MTASPPSIPFDPNESDFQAAIRLMCDTNGYDIWTRASATDAVLRYIESGHEPPAVWDRPTEELRDLASASRKELAELCRAETSMRVLRESVTEMRTEVGIAGVGDDIALGPGETPIEAAERIMLDEEFDPYARNAAALTVLTEIDDLVQIDHDANGLPDGELKRLADTVLDETGEEIRMRAAHRKMRTADEPVWTTEALNADFEEMSEDERYLSARRQDFVDSVGDRPHPDPNVGTTFWSQLPGKAGSIDSTLNAARALCSECNEWTTTFTRFTYLSFVEVLCNACDLKHAVRVYAEYESAAFEDCNDGMFHVRRFVDAHPPGRFAIKFRPKAITTGRVS